LKFTEQRWNRLCFRLNINPGTSYQQLIQAYSEPHRHYHNQQHISECLALLDWAEPKQNTLIDLVEVALWYHDVIYQPQKTDNEKQSAVIACQLSPLSTHYKKTIHSLIMATCHDTQANNDAKKLIIDIDLGILSQSEARFLEYENQIRKEYLWVSEAIYNAKRKKILQQFINRQSIYYTDYFQHHLEDRARYNINQSINKLQQITQ